MNKADNRKEYIYMGTDFRKEIGATIDQRSSEYTKISDAIWGFAEPRFQEYESSKLQQEFLKSRGFSVKSDLAGEETAFIAEWGSGKPILAFLVSLMHFPVFSRKQTTWNAARSRERRTDMAAVIICSEQLPWLRWIP